MSASQEGLTLHSFRILSRGPYGMSARAFTQESNVYAAHTMPTRTQTEAAFTHHPQRKKESPTDTFLDGTAAIYTA
ncbi:MAG: hypothetical protein U0745_03630 [Polyangia bacterium]